MNIRGKADSQKSPNYFLKKNDTFLFKTKISKGKSELQSESK